MCGHHSEVGIETIEARAGGQPKRPLLVFGDGPDLVLAQVLRFVGARAGVDESPAIRIEPSQPATVGPYPDAAAAILVEREERGSAGHGRGEAIADKRARPPLEAVEPAPFGAHPDATFRVF